jgi:hypothetical protein
MYGHLRKLAVLATAFVGLVVLSVGAQAADLNVYCGQKRFPNTINGALQLLNPAGPNTLTVSGTCNENVLIAGFNRLKLRTTTGATINDASGGTDFVVNIDDSTDVVLNGFTINGGVLGVSCGNFSVCRFNRNTIQGASVAGIQLYQSRGTFGVNTLQNNGNGLVVNDASSVRTYGGLVIQQNLGDGVNVSAGSSFQSFGDTIQNNAGNGIASYSHGYLLLLGTTITGNGMGVAVLGQSAAEFGNNVITGNGYDGVLVRDLSYASFFGGDTITGNPILDVECQDYFTVVRGVTNIGGGITNCTNASAPQPSGLNRALPRSR